MAITKRKVSFELDLRERLKDIPAGRRQEIKETLGQALIDQIIRDASNGISSVTGKRWSGLSKDYKKEKVAQGKSGKADLDLTSSMLNSLDYRIKGNKIEIGVFDSNEAIKAFNHNTGDTLPQRQFIPDENQSFRPGIDKFIDDLIRGDNGRES